MTFIVNFLPIISMFGSLTSTALVRHQLKFPRRNIPHYFSCLLLEHCVVVLYLGQLV